jgi:putative hemolysin
MLDPAAVYCQALGYEYYRTKTPKGAVGLCKLPNGRLVRARSFFAGKVALEFSYCAKEGYEAKRIENGTICRSCTACVLPGGEEQTVTKLMGLNFAESRCGDGACGTMEHIGNCPSDCDSGLHDEYCDGLADGRCDLDCVEQGGDDPDCADGAAAQGSSGGCGCDVRGDATPGVAAALLALLAMVRRLKLSGWSKGNAAAVDSRPWQSRRDGHRS